MLSDHGFDKSVVVVCQTEDKEGKALKILECDTSKNPREAFSEYTIRLTDGLGLIYALRKGLTIYAYLGTCCIKI